MEKHITLTLLLAAACILCAQAFEVSSDNVKEKKELSFVRSIGFHNVSGYYIYVNADVQANFAQATKACNILGMALISFETQQKYDVISSYLFSNDLNTDFWSSGSMVLDTFIWTGTGQAFTFTKWLPDEPDIDHDDLCVDFIPSLGWWDEDCAVQYYSICE